MQSAVYKINGKPIYAEFANRDISARPITETYLTKDEFSGVSADLASAVSAIEYISGGMTELSGTVESVSADISGLSAAIADEVFTRSGADAVIREDISKISADLDDLQYIVDNTVSALSADISDVSATLESNIADEMARAMSAESDIYDYVDSVSADLAERMDSLSAVSALSAAVDEEHDRAEVAETALSAAIGDLMESVTDTVNELSAAVDSGLTELDNVKIDRVEDAVEGNIAIFGPQGELIDTGISAEKVLQDAVLFSTTDGLHSLLNPEDITQVYIHEMTNDEIDAIIDNLNN